MNDDNKQDELRLMRQFKIDIERTLLKYKNGQSMRVTMKQIENLNENYKGFLEPLYKERKEMMK